MVRGEILALSDDGIWLSDHACNPLVDETIISNPLDSQTDSPSTFGQRHFSYGVRNVAI